MVTAVGLDSSGAANPLPATRSLEGGRSATSIDEQPGAVDDVGGSVSSAAAIVVLPGGTDGQSKPEERQGPADNIARLPIAAKGFNGALDIRFAADVADEPRILAGSFVPPFSGLVVRAVNLYDSTALILASTPPRGTAVNASS